MMYRDKPHFIIKANLQKTKKTGKSFQDVITEDVMTAVCQKITGLSEYTFEFSAVSVFKSVKGFDYLLRALCCYLHYDLFSGKSFGEDQQASLGRSAHAIHFPMTKAPAFKYI